MREGIQEYNVSILGTPHYLTITADRDDRDIAISTPDSKGDSYNWYFTKERAQEVLVALMNALEHIGAFDGEDA